MFDHLHAVWRFVCSIFTSCSISAISSMLDTFTFSYRFQGSVMTVTVPVSFAFQFCFSFLENSSLKNKQVFSFLIMRLLHLESFTRESFKLLHCYFFSFWC